jgi:4-diphosphocytidyl-2-C-methyl-D-erythritol kinase
MHAAPLTDFAPAKVNLTLRILGRRADGYHELESLVAFADVGDRLALLPGETLSLAVGGPTAAAAGVDETNLVMKAARALSARVEGLRCGEFSLDKMLPVAAGLGGGSSDAAAALRLLARENAIAFDDPRLLQAAREVGADVPVCLEPRARIMRGIGERLSPAIDLPPIPAVLVNPRVPVATRDVFAALNAAPASPSASEAATPSAAETWSFVESGVNDLQAPAIALQPVIAAVLTALAGSHDCLLARMSGSGATCFGLYATPESALAAAAALAAAQPGWWVAATTLR